MARTARAASPRRLRRTAHAGRGLRRSRLRTGLALAAALVGGYELMAARVVIMSACGHVPPSRAAGATRRSPSAMRCSISASASCRSGMTDHARLARASHIRRTPVTGEPCGALLLDDLVGAGEDSRRNGEPEGLGGLHVRHHRRDEGARRLFDPSAAAATVPRSAPKAIRPSRPSATTHARKKPCATLSGE